MATLIMATVIFSTVSYVLVSTLIFVIRHGQLKDIEKNSIRLQKYHKEVFVGETLWGLGFIFTAVTTLVFEFKGESRI